MLRVNYFACLMTCFLGLSCGLTSPDYIPYKANEGATSICEESITAFETNLAPAITNKCMSCHGAQTTIKSQFFIVDDHENNITVIKSYGENNLFAKISDASHGGGDLSADMTEEQISTWLTADEACTPTENTEENAEKESNTGGDNTGGDNTGSDNTGSDNTGGDNTGGDNTGGDNTGGDNSGGDTSGMEETCTDCETTFALFAENIKSTCLICHGDAGTTDISGMRFNNDDANNRSVIKNYGIDVFYNKISLRNGLSHSGGDQSGAINEDDYNAWKAAEEAFMP